MYLKNLYYDTTIYTLNKSMYYNLQKYQQKPYITMNDDNDDEFIYYNKKK
jgi:hypothetical protein